MIDIQQLRKNQEHIQKKLQTRIDKGRIDDVLAADKRWRKNKSILDDLLAKKNELSKLAKDDTGAREEVKTLKRTIDATQDEVNKDEHKLLTTLRSIPNIPDDETPIGASEKDNVIIREVGDKKKFSFTPKPYLQLSDIEKSVNLTQASRVSGARFAYITGIAAKIEFALLSYATNKLSSEGYELVFPPTLIKKEAMQGMGYLDQGGEEEVFHIEKDNLYLIGTAEQAIGPLLMNTTLSHADLPKRYMAFTPAYRREAGSYGKDTKGILRLHQFEKLEMFSFSSKEDSKQEHIRMLEFQESFMQDLDLPYRVVDLSTGDLGLPSSRTFDIETFLPGQNNGKGEYRETHSTSNCTDYQARRLQIKYQADSGKKEYVHTINGTAFAMQRLIIAIMENYQTKDGSFTIPKALIPYIPGSESA